MWLHNGRALAPGDLPSSVRIRAFDDNVCSLELDSVDAERTGTYTAVATNVYGTTHSSADVTVAGLGKRTDRISDLLQRRGYLMGHGMIYDSPLKVLV